MSVDPTLGVSLPASVVEQDAPCRRCGYNLRGLALAGQCPECGTPVGVSVQGDWLRYSDPQFVQTLRRGVSFILWSILLTIVVFFVAFALRGMGRRSMPIANLIALVAYVPGIIGGWLLTVPDPSGLGENLYGAARKLIRITLIIGAVNRFVDFVVSASGPLPPSVRMTLQTIGFAAAIAGLVGQFAQLNYLSKLALRIPDPSLSKSARSIMWGFGVSYGVIVLLGFLLVLIAFAIGRSSVAGAMAGIGCFMGIDLIVVIIYVIWYIVMLFNFGSVLEHQVKLAHQTWGRKQPA